MIGGDNGIRTRDARATTVCLRPLGHIPNSLNFLKDSRKSLKRSFFDPMILAFDHA